MSCGNCTHWAALPVRLCGAVDDDGELTFGYCRRKPPQVLTPLLEGRMMNGRAGHDLGNEIQIHQIVQEATRFPITTRDTVCGKHAKRST